jgi:lipopolysaccharide export LptBFGC system permease protein LptF
MKKLAFFVALSLAVAMMSFSFNGVAEDASRDKLYNAREDLEYGYRATLQREEEESQKAQLQRYQQQQYLQEQKSLEQQTLYNMSHPPGGLINSR